MKIKFDKIIKAIENGNKFAIFIHVSPDGDAVGSGMALCEFLKAKNKTAYLCCDDNINFSVEFLHPQLETNDDIIESCDTYIFLDMSAEYRAGKYKRFATKTRGKKVLVVDHHMLQSDFGDIVVRDSEKSSTAEIIYELFNHSKIEITPEIATLLYTGIASDTGCFVHQNTTSSCHLAAADLIKKGADIKLANLELFTKRPNDYMTIVKYAIRNMKIYNDKLTLLIIKKPLYEKLGKPDSFYFIDALSHYTTDILIIATEKAKNKIKLNMRSRNTNVQKICEQFGGGGHKNAAGVEIKMPLKNVIKELKKIIL